ncbi:MAG TPA: carbohydrate-binding protein, partial [Candidatus Sulfotelmatobacter sp.]|nr:carbohydrate-binding protein [Candidatus Sulfotelmatobacter sp.]
MRSIFMAALRFTLVVSVIFATASAQTVPDWQPNTAFATGALVTFNGQQFKCIQGHTSQVGWEPPNVPALWQPVAAGSPDFSVTVAPATQSLTAGASTTYTVAVKPLNGFSGAVGLSVSGLPGGATASFNPSSVNSSGSSTLTVSTLASTAPGSNTLNIKTASGSLVHTISATLGVASAAPDFSLSVTPASQTVTAGGSATYTVSLTARNGFTSTVLLSTNNLPAGVAANFTPSSITGSGSSTLILATSGSTLAGSSTLNITGASGSLNHNASVALNVGGVTSAKTTGTIHFHLLLGIGTAQDSLTLDGDNFTDLIMSNMVAGVMYGHLIQEYAPVPNIQFNKDYLYGSVMAQLLQENLATQEYLSSSNLIDPAPDQQAV